MSAHDTDPSFFVPSTVWTIPVVPILLWLLVRSFVLLLDCLIPTVNQHTLIAAPEWTVATDLFTGPPKEYCDNFVSTRLSECNIQRIGGWLLRYHIRGCFSEKIHKKN